MLSSNILKCAIEGFYDDEKVIQTIGHLTFVNENFFNVQPFSKTGPAQLFCLNVCEG